jgi:hypothetical protein
VTEEQRRQALARVLARRIADLCRCGSVARRSRIHEGYSPSSRLAAAPKSLATRPFPIYEMGSTKMNLNLIALLVFIACAGLAGGQTITDPAHIELYITPYYNSKGPAVDVGPFSSGLAAKNETELVATIAKMKKSWDTLNFAETYVAAIRLYDQGFRKDSIYWFYSAQYRGRLFASLIARDKMGSMGDPGFELFQAQNAFQQLVGPYVNGYAFDDIDQLVQIIERVQREGKLVPDLTKIYPRVTFKPKSEWDAANKGLNEGLTTVLVTLKNEKAGIKQQRTEHGMEAKFGELPSKDLPKGSGL